MSRGGAASPSVCKRGVQRGAAPWQESEGVPRAPKGASRGAQPLWQEVWRMCLHKPTFCLILPPSSQEGGQGDGAHGRPVGTHKGHPYGGGCPVRTEGGVQRGAAPWQESEGVPRAPKGASRGAQPLWQEVWRMCLHKPTFFLILPPSSQEGGQGDGALPIEPRPRIAGSQSVRPAYPPAKARSRPLFGIVDAALYNRMTSIALAGAPAGQQRSRR